MGERLIFDTTYFIDLHREHARGAEGPAHDFARSHATTEFFTSSIAVGEFAVGFEDPRAPVLTEIRRRFRPLPVDEGVALVFGRVYRALKQSGELIGSNDLWIAATALQAEMALVTRNQEEFSRVPDLQVIGY